MDRKIDSRNGNKSPTPGEISKKMEFLLKEKQSRSNFNLGYGAKSIPSFLPKVGATLIKNTPPPPPSFKDSVTADHVIDTMNQPNVKLQEISTTQQAYQKPENFEQVPKYQPADKMKEILNMRKSQDKFKSNGKEVYEAVREPKNLRVFIDPAKVKYSSIQMGNSPTNFSKKLLDEYPEPNKLDISMNVKNNSPKPATELRIFL